MASFHSFGNPLLVAQSHVAMFFAAAFLIPQCHVLTFSLICLGGNLIFTIFQTIFGYTVIPCHIFLAIFVVMQ